MATKTTIMKTKATTTTKTSTQRINNNNEGNANNNEDSRQPPHNEAWKEGMCRTVLTNHIYAKTQRDRVAIKKDNCWGASVSDQKAQPVLFLLPDLYSTRWDWMSSNCHIWKGNWGVR